MSYESKNAISQNLQTWYIIQQKEAIKLSELKNMLWAYLTLEKIM